MISTDPLSRPALAALVGSGTVADMLAVAAQRFPMHITLRAPDGHELTYRQMYDNARQRAVYLHSRGLNRGDRVAAWMRDTADHVELYAACAVGGFVAVPCNASYTVREVAAILDDCAPRALVHSAAFADRVADLPQPDLVVIDAERSGSHFARMAAESAGAGEVPAPASSDALILGYTSGTTGRAKGAVLTHKSVLEIARLNAHSYRLPDHSVLLLTGSMSFVSVIPAHVLTHFGVAGTVVLPGTWTPADLPELVRRHRATFTYVPSPLIDEVAVAFARQPQAWTSLVTVLHSGSKASPAALGRLGDVIGDRLVEGWGMTENSGGLITVTTPSGMGNDRVAALASAGRAALDTDVEVIGADGSPLPHDGESVGELVFRSPALMHGYWGMSEQTEQTLRDGWFHSGDLGSIDRTGLVTITDRRTDLIVTGGINVYPTEVENCILDLPGVSDVGVVGLPHPRWGTGVVAAIVRAQGAVVTADDVVAHCRAQLAPFKKPTAVVFVDELPRTSSLKLSRARLRQQLAEIQQETKPTIAYQPIDW